MVRDPPIPETRVLAIASHVTHGYVGNTMATFVMQCLGCEVSAINTVQFSNHVGYGQWNGTRTSAEEIQDIFDGLKQNHLADFDVLLTGFAPSAEVVEVIGKIGRELKLMSLLKPGSFFWVLDPVMGDEGELYVDEAVVPVYKSLLPNADLLIPNLFELETLLDKQIGSPSDLVEAITRLHKTQHVPHVVVTSVHLPHSTGLAVVGSSMQSSGMPRIFSIQIPSLDCFFSGTGDLFAALTIVRMREAVADASLESTASWLSPDDVEAVELPLAKATEKVLGSMHTILNKTKDRVDKVMRDAKEGNSVGGSLSKKELHLLKTKAAEVNLVRNIRDLQEPESLFQARPFTLE